MRTGQAERIWAWEEYGQLEVGDVRRRDRVVAMASRLAGSASGHVSQAFEDRAERQGAYDL
ncbi:MAG: transposase DNA-binding-containing protein, partial [Myxococcales bacterium]